MRRENDAFSYLSPGLGLLMTPHCLIRYPQREQYFFLPQFLEVGRIKLYVDNGHQRNSNFESMQSNSQANRFLEHARSM